MTCDVLATGSKGNAAILNRALLIDCGVPFKKLEPHADGLLLVLLTHIHGDHINAATIRRLLRKRPALRFGCGSWMVQALLDAGVDARLIDVYEMDKAYQYGQEFSVSPFWLAHDVENCGYRIFFPNGEKVLYATDTGSMDGVEAKGYDLYMIEANHTEEEIAERIQRKLEAGEFVYEYRAAAGHLSKEKADAWLAENAVPGISRVIYLHGHQE